MVITSRSSEFLLKIDKKGKYLLMGILRDFAQYKHKHLAIIKFPIYMCTHVSCDPGF